MLKMLGGMVRCIGLFVVFLSALQGGFAQEEKPVPPRRLRLLTVGDAPPFQQEIRGGVRHEMEAPEGSLPPRSVRLSGEGVEEGEFQVTLKRWGNALVLPGASVVTVLGDTEDPWHRLAVPEGGDLLAVVWRDPKVGDWSKARSLFVKDDASFGAGQVRFVNVCPVDIAVILGKKRFVIKPGATVFKKVGVAAGVPIKVAYAIPGQEGWRQLYSSALVQNRGERGTVVFYRADGTRPRRPVKLVLLRDRVPPPLKVAKPKPEAAGEDPA